MCVKPPHGDLNPNLHPPHSINTYTCGVTIVLSVCGGIPRENFNFILSIYTIIRGFFV